MSRSQIAIASSIISLAVLLLMLNLTSPAEIGPFGVLLFFTTVFVFIYSVVGLLMALFYRLIGRKKGMTRKDYMYTAIISFAPIMLLMARSFGVLNILTISAILIALFLVGFLVYKKF